jgi:hypothetical protein
MSSFHRFHADDKVTDAPGPNRTRFIVAAEFVMAVALIV